MKIIQKYAVSPNLFIYVVDKSASTRNFRAKTGVWNKIFFQPNNSKQTYTKIILPSHIFCHPVEDTDIHNTILGRVRAMVTAYISACKKVKVIPPIITLSNGERKDIMEILNSNTGISGSLGSLCNSHITTDDSNILDAFLSELALLKYQKDFQYCSNLIPLIYDLFLCQQKNGETNV